MLTRPGLSLLTISLLLALLSVSLDGPPSPVADTAPDSVFSASRAYRYLEEITRAPHSCGTAENKRVREYIAAQCRQFGMSVEIEQSTAVNRRANQIFAGGVVVVAANVYNVVARIKGTRGSGKQLLVMSHFDTQPNTPGAGDDGAGVAAMLETARILTSSGKKFENDIVFLFTDGEELGMLGAVGFVQDSVNVKAVGLVLNFEGRGNGGPVNMFEVNHHNGWAIKHFKRAAAHPYGNSLGYEIYKILPNDTDFSIFRQAGIMGLNHAFTDGFVNYHSPNDKAGHLNLGSLQHHGDNMLSLIKHFGNIPLDQTEADDVAYFNVAGFWMVSHPVSWNAGLVILTFWLLSVYVVMSWRKKLLTIKGLFIGIGMYLLLLASLFLLPILLTWGINKLYPMYRHFYGSNSYNAGSYHLAFAALAVLLFSIAYRWLLKKQSLSSLLAGIFTLNSILLVLMYMKMPSAIFILLYPLIFCLAGNILPMWLTFDPRRETMIKGAVLLLSLLPALWWLPNAVNQMFIIFGLSVEVGAPVLIAGILLGLMLPLFEMAFADLGAKVAWISLGVFVAALLAGHFRSGYSKEKPLQSYVSYQLKADSNKAYWVSALKDHWNAQFFPNPRMEGPRMFNEAKILPLTAPTLTIKHDSTANDVRYLHLHCAARPAAISMRVDFGSANPAIDVSVEGPAEGFGNLSRPKGKYLTVHYAGLDSTGFDLIVETKPEAPFEVLLTDRSLGLPLDGYQDYPEDVVPGTNFNANTVQVSKTYRILEPVEIRR